MSTKNILTEWRRFLKEESELEGEVTPELEYKESDAIEGFEGSKQMQGFFVEADVDMSSQEAMDFFAACDKPENARACDALSEICMNFEQNPDSLIKLLEKFLAAAAVKPQNSDPVDFDEEM